MERPQLIAQQVGTASAAQIGLDGENPVRQHDAVFLECVPNDDPVQYPQPAAKEESRGRGEKKNELRRDRARFNRL